MQEELSVQEVVFTPVPDLARPVVIVSVAVVEHLQSLMDRASRISEVTTPAERAEAADVFNLLGRVLTVSRARMLDLGRPFRDESARIKSDGEEVLTPAETVKCKLGRIMALDKAKTDAAEKAALAEKNRLFAEARLREQEAVKKTEAAKAEKGFESGAKAFDAALQTRAIAEEVAVPVVQKPRGVRYIPTAHVDHYELDKLPIAYHMLDEKKLKKHILDGTITEKTLGVRFRITQEPSGTGR